MGGSQSVLFFDFDGPPHPKSSGKDYGGYLVSQTKSRRMIWQKKIIFDTDPGVDDTMALTFALRSPELEVVGVTSVFGNAAGPITAQNALRLVELEGNDHIPVAHGADRGIILPAIELASEVHGADGMGEYQSASAERQAPGYFRSSVYC